MCGYDCKLFSHTLPAQMAAIRPFLPSWSFSTSLTAGDWKRTGMPGAQWVICRPHDLKEMLTKSKAKQTAIVFSTSKINHHPIKTNTKNTITVFRLIILFNVLFPRFGQLLQTSLATEVEPAQLFKRHVMLRLPIVCLCDLTLTQRSRIYDLTLHNESCYVNYARAPSSTLPDNPADFWYSAWFGLNAALLSVNVLEGRTSPNAAHYAKKI